MPENNNLKNNTQSDQSVIVVGSADGPQTQVQAPAPFTPNGPIRHRFAEAYIVISLIAMIILGIIFPITLAFLFVFIGEIPAGALGLINIIVVPILLRKKFLTGAYRGLAIVLLALSALAVLTGTLFLIGIKSITHMADEKSQQMTTYYNQQDAAARSEASVQQATQLLNSCQVFGFYYTKQNGTDGSENAETTSTGILLYKLPKSFDNTTTPSSGDAGKYRIHIADRMVNTMVPIARNAQGACGIQFWHDGDYEQYKNGKWYFKGQAIQNTESGKSREDAINFMRSCKTDYFVGYTDINLVKDASTRAWLKKAEQSSSGIEISEEPQKSYVFTSKAMTTALQDTAKQFRQTCYSAKKLYVVIDNSIETEYPIGTWVRVPQ